MDHSVYTLDVSSVPAQGVETEMIVVTLPPYLVISYWIYSSGLARNLSWGRGGTPEARRPIAGGFLGGGFGEGAARLLSTSYRPDMGESCELP